MKPAKLLRLLIEALSDVDGSAVAAAIKKGGNNVILNDMFIPGITSGTVSGRQLSHILSNCLEVNVQFFTSNRGELISLLETLTGQANTVDDEGSEDYGSTGEEDD